MQTTTQPQYIDRQELLKAAVNAGVTRGVTELAERCDLARITMTRYVNKVYPLAPVTEAKLRDLLGSGSGPVPWLTSQGR